MFSNRSYPRDLYTCLILKARLWGTLSFLGNFCCYCFSSENPFNLLSYFISNSACARTIRVLPIYLSFFSYYIFIITMHAAQPPFIHSEKLFYSVDRLIVGVVSFNSLWHSRQVSRQTPKINNIWMVSKEVYFVPKCFHGNLQIKFCQCSREY